MTLHIPGPWSIELDRNECPLIVAADNTFTVCAVSGAGDVAHANARLIAAAPDLLRALKHAVHWHDQLRASDVLLMEKAIAKTEVA